MECNTIRKKLKSIDQIVEENGGVCNWTWSSHKDGSIVNNYINWTINSKMRKKFGDDNFYTFTKIFSEDNVQRRFSSNLRYTHRCKEDKFVYHESWFEEDFLLPSELFEL